MPLCPMSALCFDKRVWSAHENVVYYSIVTHDPSTLSPKDRRHHVTKGQDHNKKAHQDDRFTTEQMLPLELEVQFWKFLGDTSRHTAHEVTYCYT